MDINTLIWLLPLPPLLAFFLIVLFANRSNLWSSIIGVGAALLSWAGAMVVFFNAIGVEGLAEHPLGSAVKWLATGDTYLEIGVAIDPISAVTVFFVGWTVLCIFLYSVGYHNFGQPKGDHDAKGLQPHGATVTDEHGHKHTVMSVEPMYARFFAFIGLFAFGMYTLVISDNLLTMFVGWEIMGLCSYLLIGFWYQKPSARAAAIKAFLTTRIGDVFMLLGIAWLYTATGTLNFHEIFSHHLTELSHAAGLFGWSAAASIGVLLFIGTIGKSAQFPLHVWLPDAMEGPTPVSAMIHAATMVSAGVYAMIRMYPLLSAGAGDGYTPAMIALAVVGAFTALFAATIAVAQNDIKRVLAYSTISQLGFMIAALGIGGPIAATFHLVTHAFFKALLFLGSGSVIHGMEHGVYHTGDHHVDPQDMFNMGGLRKKMPVTFWTFLIGGFALAGFPLVTAGFWSKDEILTEAFNAHGLAGGIPMGMVVFIVLALAAFMTAFYTMRQITLTFFGEPKTKEAEHAHETPWTMTLPLAILAVFAIAFGWVGIPEQFPVLGGLLPNWWHEFIGSAFHVADSGKEALMIVAAEAEEAHSPIPLITSLIVSLGGLGLGYWYYRGIGKAADDRFQIPLLKNKYYFDELYEATFVRLAQWLSNVFAIFLDRQVIDGFLHAVAAVVSPVGTFLREYVDNRVVNWSGDAAANVTQAGGRNLKFVQTGKIQVYMLTAVLFAVAAVVYFSWIR